MLVQVTLWYNHLYTKKKKKNIPNLLHSNLDVFGTWNGFTIRAQNRLLRLALVAEDVAVAADEDVVALVVQGEDLSAL